MERDLARKYKVQFATERKQLEESLQAYYKQQFDRVRAELTERIAEVARLKSLE